MGLDEQMKRITTAELIRNFGVHSDIALSMPIVVTKNDRDRLVLISVEQFEKLKQVYDVSEFTQGNARREGAKAPRPRGGTRP